MIRVIEKVESKYKCRGWLYIQYWLLEKSTKEISEKENVSSTTILNWLKKYKIKIRNLSEAKKLNDKKYPNRSGFQKNHKINQGKKYSKERCEKIANGKRGSKNPMFNIDPKKHPMWKGDNATKEAIHMFLKKNNIPPKKCQKCKKNRKIYLSFDHSLGKYTRNIEDYEWLCWPCHMKKDYNLGVQPILFGGY